MVRQASFRRLMALLLALAAGGAADGVRSQPKTATPAPVAPPSTSLTSGDSAKEPPIPPGPSGNPPAATGAPTPESPAKSGEGETPKDPPPVAPLKPPALSPEPVRIWQPEGPSEAAPKSKPLPRRAPVGGTPNPAGLVPGQPPGMGAGMGGDPRGLPPGMRPGGPMLRGPVMRGPMPPGMMPPGAMVPGGVQRGGLPPGALPPGVLPPGAMPPGGRPPVAIPPEANLPQLRQQQAGSPEGQKRGREETWSPWMSIGAGLVLAAGVTAVVTMSRRRPSIDADQQERQADDRLPRG